MTTLLSPNEILTCIVESDTGYGPDRDLILILSDNLEEQGYLRHAVIWRWIAKNFYRPCTTNKFPWYGPNHWRDYRVRQESFRLPSKILTRDLFFRLVQITPRDYQNMTTTSQLQFGYGFLIENLLDRAHDLTQE